jgi:uncharacterized protein YfaS (alpha-2-macroglobulin family)
MAAYTIGDLIELRADFASGGAAVDPDTVICKVKDPDGTVTQPTVSHDSAGVYTAEIAVTKKGRWTYRFAGTGGYQGARERDIRVERSAFEDLP